MNHERATTPALFVTARQWGCRPAFYQTDPLRDKPPNTNHQFDWMCNQNTNTRLQKSKLFWRQRVALLVFSLTIFILFLSISVNLSTPSIVSSLRNWCDQGFWLQVFHAWKKKKPETDKVWALNTPSPSPPTVCWLLLKMAPSCCCLLSGENLQLLKSSSREQWEARAGDYFYSVNTKPNFPVCMEVQ